jgi:cobalt-zinc-cadmium efflux system outer membrane protein
VLQAKSDVFVSPVVDTNAAKSLDPLKYPLTTLIDSAYQSRTDLMIAKAGTNISKLNYDYQKSLAVPDLNANIGFDQQGSFVNNLTMAGVSIDIPIFNRNQGNIKSALRLIDSSVAFQKSVEATVEENVTRALQKAVAQDKLYKSIDPAFSAEFEYLKNQVLINYQKRNIGLLDFLDFYDSYKQNALQLNTIQYNRVQALEDINFYTGTNFFN